MSAVVPVQSNVQPEFLLFRRREWLRRAQPPPCSEQHLNAVYRCPLVRVENNETFNRWVVCLEEARLTRVLTRSALQFVPFPFSRAQSVLDHIDKEDPDMQWIEMGQAGLAHTVIYTPPLWLLLKTERYGCEDDRDLAKFDVTVPAHYYYRQLRIVLFMLTRGDHTSVVEEELAAEEEPEWMRHGSDMDKAYELFCLKSKEMRKAYLEMYRKELDYRQRALDQLPWSDKEYLQWMECFQKRVEEDEDREKASNEYAAWMRAMESVKDDFPAAKERALANHRSWLQTNAEFEQEDYVDTPPVERKFFPQFFAQTVQARTRKIKALEAKLERQTKIQDDWEAQLSSLFERHCKLMTMQRNALRDRYLQRDRNNKEQLRELLHMYTVGIINATEMLLMTLCHIPLNLRQSLQTNMSQPPPELVSNEVAKACDDFAAKTATAAIEQRHNNKHEPQNRTDWIFPPALPEELLSDCKTAVDYYNILEWLLDNWTTPKEEEKEAPDGTKEQ